MDYASGIFEPAAFLYSCQPRNDMRRQKTNLPPSLKGEGSGGNIPCDRHLGAVDFGLGRNDERAETNCSLHTELAEESAAVNLERGLVLQAHYERVEGKLPVVSNLGFGPKRNLVTGVARCWLGLPGYIFGRRREVETALIPVAVLPW